ncbi:hypothetical protein Tco_1173105, partial [Tanacetum coccineum]
MQQPMQNSKDSSDPKTAMNMTLALLAKAFKVHTIPTNNNQRSSLIPHNSQIAQPDINTSQDLKMQMVNDNVGNLIAQEEEVGIQSTQDEFEFMTAADDHEETQRVQYTKCEECKYDKISYDKAYNDMQQKIEWLQAQLGDLKGKSSDTQCASNTFDMVSLKLKDENVSLESQVSTQKGTTKGTRTNTMFTKQSILGKPPSSYKPKLYSVTPFPKSSVLPKVDKTNALLKPVTSNSAPSTRESKGVQTVKVIASRIFRTNHSKTSRVDNVVPNKPVKTSVRIKPITVSQPNVIHKQQANSDS